MKLETEAEKAKIAEVERAKIETEKLKIEAERRRQEFELRKMEMEHDLRSRGVQINVEQDGGGAGTQ